MKGGEWRFDASDKTVSTKDGDVELEVCFVSRFDIYDGDKRYGSKYVFGEKSKAHAALITSAPALLEALEKAREDIILYRIDAGLEPEDCDLIEIIDAAIAAARGAV